MVRKSVDVRFKWIEIQMIWLSIDVWFEWFWLSVDLRFKWVGCQLVFRFSWVGWQMIWDSSDLDVKWFEVLVFWLSTDVWVKCFCQTKLFCETSFKHEALKLNEAFVRDFLQKWSFEAQRSFCARHTRQLKNEAFARDFLQTWSFEAPKRSISARRPPKIKLWRSKTKHFC